MEYIYSLAVALFLTIALIPMLIRMSGRLGLVDEPGEARKLHSTTMPRTGGIGIIFGAMLPLGFLLHFEGYLLQLFLACMIIVVFGLLDDKIQLNYKWKLIGQSLAAVTVMSGGLVLNQLPFLGLDDAPVWLCYPITFVFLIGVVNGVNFSDGMDGLAAGTSLVALLVLFTLALQAENFALSLISLTIVGGVLGFLRFNTSPATIFMGDAGSQFLGFIIACLAIGVTQDDLSAYNALLPLLILGIPVMDIIQVVPVRIYKKLPLPGPDKEHFHHQIGKLGFRHIEVVVTIYILQTILMVAAYVLRYSDDFTIALFYASFVVLTLGTLLVLNKVGWKLRSDVSSSCDRRSRPLRKLDWYYCNSPNCLAVLLALFFLALSVYFSRSGGLPISLPIYVAVGVLLFAISSMGVALQLYRVILYSASVAYAYFLSRADLPAAFDFCINSYLVVMLMLLMLAIRMTRKQIFSLNTQDMLILLVVVVLPLFTFEGLGQYEVGRIALTSAVLMYVCEFILARQASLCALPAAFALAAIGLLPINYSDI